MAKFNHFRIIIAILAAFAAFFAFVCRFNLSIVIEEMVIKHRNIGSGQSVLQDMAEVSPVGLNGQKPGGTRPNSDDQTIAALSSGEPRWLKMQGEQVVSNVRSSSSSSSSSSSDTRDQTNWRESMPVLEESPVETLAADFDINKKLNQRREQLKQQKASSGSIGSVSSHSVQKRQVDTGQPGKEEGEENDKLNWSEESKNQLLGAFFITYAICQIPAGRAAEIFGAKALILAMGFGSGLGSLLFPYAARWTDGTSSAYAIRLAIGACQAGIFPAIYVLLCEWLPKSERSTWLAVPSAMGRIGTIVMNLLVPLILKNFNWQAVFLICGTVTLVWSVLFLIFGSDSPATSGWLSDRELLYIESRMEPRTGTLHQAATRERGAGGGPSSSSLSSLPSPSPTSSIDWLKLITNRPMLLLTLVMFSSEWSNMLLITKLPGFLSSAMFMGVTEISLWTSLLIAVYCFQYPLSGIVASRLEAANIRGLDSLNLRKLFEAAAHLLQAGGALLIASFTGKAITLIGLFVIMLGRSTTGGGQCQMPPELSKEFPGTVMALTNSGATFASVLGPSIINWMVKDANNYDSWRGLWFFSAGLYVLAGLLFVLFGDNSPQDFSKRFTNKSNARSTSQAELVLPPYIVPHRAEPIVATVSGASLRGGGGGGGGRPENSRGRRNKRAAPSKIEPATSAGAASWRHKGRNRSPSSLTSARI